MIKAVSTAACVMALALGSVACGASRDDAPPVAPSSSARLSTVPDVRGHNAAVAEDELKRAGFTNVDLTPVDGIHSIVLIDANWNVETQSAAPGSHPVPDGLIVLGVTK